MAKKKKETFSEWRKRKGLSIDDIVREFKGEIPASTMGKWAHFDDRKPRRGVLNMFKKKFPDHPWAA